jgi:hypothetical protein
MKQTAVRPEQAYALLADGSAPRDLHVDGALDYSRKSERPLPAEWPTGLAVDLLDVSGQDLTALPGGLRAYELNAAETPLLSLPADIAITSRLDLTRCDRLESLPVGLTVGSLVLRGCTALERLPEGLDVWFLDLSGCWALQDWPAAAKIRSGQLQLRDCTALRSLPPYLQRLSALNVRDCPNLTSLPADLTVSGWLELGHSGLAREELLPPGLEKTQLRWAGINVDRRIAFYPETIRIDEILAENNAERRRVLLDRYGFSRFLKDARAETLDRDSDPGGERQLLRVKLPGDEDLVAMSCFCPSTRRQYMLRVPPAMLTCRQAAAWIAGFDNADDYQPIIET